MKHSLLCLLLLLPCALMARERRPTSPFGRAAFAPFYLETDIGDSTRERQRQATVFARAISRNVNSFLNIMGMQNEDFNAFANFYGAADGHFNPHIRIRIWRHHRDFLDDFRTRFQQPDAEISVFSAITQDIDSAGLVSGPYFQEIGTAALGRSETQILASLYHQMGSLFCRTFLLVQSEMPIWISSGIGHTFRLMRNNGTNPDAQRRENIAWMYEVLEADHSFGAAIPWDQLMQVNLSEHNRLVQQDPFRSGLLDVHYWSITEFLTDRRRQRAYSSFLQGLRQHAMQRHEALAAQGQRGEDYQRVMRPLLYQVQSDLFSRAFRQAPADFLDEWRGWVQESYQQEAQRHPEMLYLRGTWHLDRRLRLAPEQAVAQHAYRQALSLFEQAVAEHPQHPAGFVGLARLAQLRQDSEAASQHFATALSLGGDSFEVQVFGGAALIASGQADQAIAGLEKAVETRPDHVDANLHLGRALIITGSDLNRGIALVRHAAQSRPDQPDLRLYEGLGHYLLGNFDQSFQAFADVYMASQRQHAVAAAAAAAVRHRQMEREDTQRWLGWLRNLDPDMGERLAEKLRQSGAIGIGVLANGEVAVAGVSSDAESVIIPKQ